VELFNTIIQIESKLLVYFENYSRTLWFKNWSELLLFKTYETGENIQKVG